ncbi:unnamed protein product [Brachionus calyciflorus]|uniref:Arginyl-tRNA--protein transferase 1 n=1 Tax=Brachionus calyciflorus TaxID=104777 RepID=A0A813X4A6_9BILA|nr:unnamed protein product [Brachionus calyciflorus]
MSSNTLPNNLSVVSLYGIDDLTPHHCGYCNENGSVSTGMSSDSLRIEHYQKLIDRGWRRSGTYIYKPVMNVTCCPLYTIKCDALSFQLRKSQKNTLKSVRKYLEKGEKKKESLGKKETENSNTTTTELSNIKNHYIQDRIKQTQNTHAKKVMAFFLDKKLNTADFKSKSPNELLNIPKLKAKHKRLFFKLLNLKEKNQINTFSDILGCLKRKMPKPDADSIENYLTICQNPLNKLELKLVRSYPPSNEFENSLTEEHQIYTKYQMKIHKDSEYECSLHQFKRFLCNSPLLAESYNGPLSNINNTDILQRSDIQHDLIGNVSALGYGSFHQQYILNGKIIAVGVIDILDHCVSSVYFFYDPDYQFLNMGTYSALREIEFVRQLSKIDPNIKWYYLGFYAHSCRKMRYKGFFHPSYLLCPEMFTWHPIEYCVPLLNLKKYCRLALNENENNQSANTEDQSKIDNIDNVNIKIRLERNRTRNMKFKDLRNYLSPDHANEFIHMIRGYCNLFGKSVSDEIIIKF